MNINYPGARVMLRDEITLYRFLVDRADVSLDGYEPVAVVGTVVRVIKAPEGSGLPPQLLVFWEGADFVPDTTTWEMPMWLEPAYQYGGDGFPLFSVETDGYGSIVLRNPQGAEVSSVAIDLDDQRRDQAFFDAVVRTVAGWWRKQQYTIAGK